MHTVVIELGIVFLVGFILPIVPVFPVRLAVLIPIVAATVNPVAVVLAASLGSCLGTLPLYAVTREAGKLAGVSRWMKHRWVAWLLRVLEGKMFLTIVLFALLPLPDPLMSVIGGLKNYPVGKMAFGFFLGRIPYYALLAWVGNANQDLLRATLHPLYALFGL